LTDQTVVVLRALSFITALQAAGVPLFLWLFADDLRRAAQPIATLGRRTAALGVVFAIAWLLAEPARLAGDPRGIFDGSLQTAILSSEAGVASAVRVLGLALIVLGWLKPNRLRAAVAMAGGTLIAASFAFMGHTASHDQRWLLASLLIAHLLIVAFWFGALWPLHLASRCEELTVNAVVIERFSRIATWLVPVIFLAGLALSVALLPDLASLRKPYGLLLLTKVTGFAVLMAFAAINKWRLGPAIANGNAKALVSFRRSVFVEWALIAAVLAVTAVMTTWYSPRH
jgi:putative copper export protein